MQEQKIKAPHNTGNGVPVVDVRYSNQARMLAKDMIKAHNKVKHPTGEAFTSFMGGTFLVRKGRYPFDSFTRLNQRQKRKRARQVR